MASNGLDNYAKRGKCRMCQRVRNTVMLKPVGEVRHGYATGHIWECENEKECQKYIEKKLNDKNLDDMKKYILESAQKEGRYDKYYIKT